MNYNVKRIIKVVWENYISWNILVWMFEIQIKEIAAGTTNDVIFD